MTTTLYKGAVSRSLGSSGANAVTITHEGLFVIAGMTWAPKAAGAKLLPVCIK